MRHPRTAFQLTELEIKALAMRRSGMKMREIRDLGYTHSSTVGHLISVATEKERLAILAAGETHHQSRMSTLARARDSNSPRVKRSVGRWKQ